LRHSNSSPHEAQIFGANPFLVLAIRDMSKPYCDLKFGAEFAPENPLEIGNPTGLK